LFVALALMVAGRLSGGASCIARYPRPAARVCIGWLSVAMGALFQFVPVLLQSRVFGEVALLRLAVDRVRPLLAGFLGLGGWLPPRSGFFRSGRFCSSPGSA
jgi:hypothetical protein